MFVLLWMNAEPPDLLHIIREAAPCSASLFITVYMFCGFYYFTLYCVCVCISIKQFYSLTLSLTCMKGAIQIKFDRLNQTTSK